MFEPDISDYAGTVITTDNRQPSGRAPKTKQQRISDHTNGIGLILLGVLSYLCPIFLFIGLLGIWCYRIQVDGTTEPLSDRNGKILSIALIVIGLTLLVL